MSLTIRDIARELNLAVSTVSKALRDSHEIGESTKRLVLDYARRMNYVPNPYAGSLKNRKTKNIAVVVPEVADTFFSNAINGIERVAQEKGYHVIVYLTHENAEREASILNDLRGGRVDGILISVSGGINQNKALYSLLLTEMPLIFFDRTCEDVSAAKVLTNDFESAYEATSHLIKQGCTEFVFLAAEGNLSIVDERLKGFRSALTDHVIKKSNQHVLLCTQDEQVSLKTITKFIKDKRNTLGVLASVEKLAMQTYTACHVCNRCIPTDVKVVAFSNLQIAPLMAPPLTTVVQPAFDMGHAAATLLFRGLVKKVFLANERHVLNSLLCERGSTGLI